MKRLLLVLPLLLVAADTPQEIEGWKVIGTSAWQQNESCLTPIQDQGMLQHEKPITGRLNVKATLKIEAITDEKFFRCGLYFGQTTDVWTEGQRVEVVLTSSQFCITIMDYAPGATPLKVLAKRDLKPPVPKPVQIMVKVVSGQAKSSVSAQCGKERIDAQVPYGFDGTRWGLIVNRAKASYTKIQCR